MIDKKLDDLLNKGKKESDHFFIRSNADSVRNIVLRKLSSGWKKNLKRGGIPPLLRKAGLPAACIAAALLLLFCSGIFGVPSGAASLAQNTAAAQSINEQTISLDSKESAVHVNFFPVSASGGGESDLMSVLWKMDAAGQAQTLYSCLLNDSDLPYPVSIIEIPGMPEKLVLIASGSSEHGFINYRLVKYLDEDITTLLSQDYVPLGKINVQNGVIVEKRQAVARQSLSESRLSNTQVSYIVPYGVSIEGSILLPVQNLHIPVGCSLQLLGCGSDQFAFSSQNGNIKQLEQNITMPDAPVSFIASHTGDDAILMTDHSGTGEHILTVHVEG